MICKKCRFYRRRGFIGRVLDFCTAPNKPDWDWDNYVNAVATVLQSLLSKLGHVPSMAIRDNELKCRHYEKSITHVIIDSVSKILGVRQ